MRALGVLYDVVLRVAQFEGCRRNEAEEKREGGGGLIMLTAEGRKGRAGVEQAFVTRPEDLTTTSFLVPAEMRTWTGQWQSDWH